MHRLDTNRDLQAAVNWLTMVEPRFGDVVARHGLPPLRHAEPGLESLLRIVTDQMISLKAGAAIWVRLVSQLGHFAPRDVLSASEADLRALGLSGAKARTFRAAALAFSEGRFEGWEKLSEAEVQRRLIQIPGVGPWTASIYLLMSLRVADAWPAADLALQIAAQDLLGLADRPPARRMMELAEAWRPHRSAAALLLWWHYRAIRGMSAG